MPKRIPGETPPMEGVETKKAKKAPEKKETKLEGLERRVLLVRDFYKAVTAIRADLSVAETDAELDRIFQGFFDKAPATLKRKFFRHQKDEQRIVELEESFVDDLQEDSDDFSLEEADDDPVRAELDKLSLRLGKNRGDFDLVFLLEIKKAVESFKFKKREVEKARLSPEKIYQLIPPDKIKAMFFRAFEISVVVDGNWFEQNFQSTDTRGFHYRGTVISLIRGREQFDPSWEEDKTGGHESIHNFLDFRPDFFETGEAMQRWQGLVEEYLEESGQDEPFVNSLNYYRRNLEKFDAWRIVDEEHEEILAAMEGAENAAFKKTAGSEEVIFGKGVPSLTTAQFRINEKINYFKKKSTRFNDPFLKEHFERVGADLERNFAQVAAQMKSAFEIGRRIGGDASEFAHFAFVLLKPSQFGLAERLLAERYGFEAVEKAKQEFLFVEKADFSVEFLEEFKKRLLSPDQRPSTEDIVVILDSLFVQIENGGEIREIGIENLDGIRKVCLFLEEIIPLARVSEKTAKKISSLLSHIQVRYFGDFLDNIPRQERAEIPTEFFDLRPKELEELIRALEIHVPYVKEDLVTILNKEEITIQDVYESLFWKIVQLAGVEEKFRPEIEKMFAA